MNEKGFAVSGILYSILLLFMIIVISVITMLGDRRTVLERIKREVLGELSENISDFYDEAKGVNKPRLSEGMIPIKWDGSNWIATTADDSNWYDYNNKQWANVATIDKTKVIDYSGNKNVGSINGAAGQSDGIYFDGVDDYIVVDQLKNYNFNNNISLVAKFNIKTINKPTSHALFGNWENAGGGISVNSSNSINFQLYINGAYRLVQSTTKVEANKYYTVVGTYDGNQMKLYINGQLNNTLAITGNILASAVPFGVGANPNASSYMDYSDATISDVGIYKTALSATQISTNFSEQPNFMKDNSLLIYNFKEGNHFDNTIIDVSNMNTMWVWIPRYAYKITSGYHSSTTGTIDVKFLKGSSTLTSDETAIEDNGYVVGVKDTSVHYFVHPTFQNNINKYGFWVAKFEPTAAEGVANGYVANYSCPSNEDNVTIKTIKVVPNVQSWRCISNKNVYTTTLEMKNKANIYGWISNNVDTHMITNLEWGAVYYLTLSTYGANTQEVYINNSQTYITGCAGNTASAGSYNGCQNAYNTIIGGKASTTGNITGVYDMSGGAWDRTMGIYNNLTTSSGFTIEEITNMPSKYLTRYTTPSANLLNGIGMNYDTTVYGDGIYETSAGSSRYNGTSWIGNDRGVWNSEISYLPFVSYSWFSRGAASSSDVSIVGVGSFGGQYAGEAINHVTFRPVVSIIK